MACLEHLATERGAPAWCFDYGSELIAYAVADWCRFNGTGTAFIDPRQHVAKRLDRIIERSCA